jgi:hypothetical protein
LYLSSSSTLIKCPDLFACTTFTIVFNFMPQSQNSQNCWRREWRVRVQYPDTPVWKKGFQSNKKILTLKWKWHCTLNIYLIISDRYHLCVKSLYLYKPGWPNPSCRYDPAAVPDKGITSGWNQFGLAFPS